MIRSLLPQLRSTCPARSCLCPRLPASPARGPGSRAGSPRTKPERLAPDASPPLPPPSCPPLLAPRAPLRPPAQPTPPLPRTGTGPHPPLSSRTGSRSAAVPALREPPRRPHRPGANSALHAAHRPLRAAAGLFFPLLLLGCLWIFFFLLLHLPSPAPTSDRRLRAKHLAEGLLCRRARSCPSALPVRRMGSGLGALRCTAPSHSRASRVGCKA